VDHLAAAAPGEAVCGAVPRCQEHLLGRAPDPVGVALGDFESGADPGDARAVVESTIKSGPPWKPTVRRVRVEWLAAHVQLALATDAVICPPRPIAERSSRKTLSPGSDDHRAVERVADHEPGPSGIDEVPPVFGEVDRGAFAQPGTGEPSDLVEFRDAEDQHVAGNVLDRQPRAVGAEVGARRMREMRTRRRATSSGDVPERDPLSKSDEDAAIVREPHGSGRTELEVDGWCHESGAGVRRAGVAAQASVSLASRDSARQATVACIASPIRRLDFSISSNVMRSRM
jgi:hypothetical protein